MFKANQDIREAIEENGLRYWEVADKYGLTDGNFSKKLRKELPVNEKQRIHRIIMDLQKEQRRLENA